MRDRKQACVYLRHETYFVHSMSASVRRLWIAVPPFAAIPHDRLDSLSEAVLQSLSASEEGITEPTQLDRVFDPILKLARVGSYSAFARGAACVSVERTDGKTFVVPSRSSEDGRGFEDWPEATIQVENDGGLAPAIVESFARIARGV